MVPIEIRRPKRTSTSAGLGRFVYKTDLLGAIQNGHRCGTCGGGARLYIFTIGAPPKTDPDWWRNQRIFCTIGCWIGRPPLRRPDPAPEARLVTNPETGLKSYASWTEDGSPVRADGSIDKGNAK